MSFLRTPEDAQLWASLDKASSGDEDCGPIYEQQHDIQKGITKQGSYKDKGGKTAKQVVRVNSGVTWQFGGFAVAG